MELPLFYAGVPRREANERTLEALARVGLEQRADHRPAKRQSPRRQSRRHLPSRSSPQ